jgi:hypothetical protein
MRTNLKSLAGLAALAISCAGCGPLSPDVQEANRYLKQLQPLLIENSHLASQVLNLAADSYNEKGDAESLAESWATQVVPLAEHLHHQTAALPAEGAWSMRQTDLVEIWGNRAQAYRGLSESLAVADRAAWTTSVAKANAVQLDEEVWFKQTNKALAALSLPPVDPTP